MTGGSATPTAWPGMTDDAHPAVNEAGSAQPEQASVPLEWKYQRVRRRRSPARNQGSVAPRV